MTFFDFPQEGLLIDVATAPTTALTLGNGPLLSATLSFVIPPAPACRGTGANPDFLPRGTGKDRVCAFR